MNHLEVKYTIISFPDIKANASAGEKLRGYISSLVNTQNENIFHNHTESGKVIYRYPRIQYKVVKKHPIIVGIMEGSDLLVKLFLNLKQLNLDGNIIPVNSKTISQNMAKVSINQGLYKYKFETLWMGLNQKNHNVYKSLNAEDKNAFLNKCLTNNILSFYKAIGLFVNDKILVKGVFKPNSANFKNVNMIVFAGSFTSNVELPDYIGLGKSASRGFGTIKQMK